MAPIRVFLLLGLAVTLAIAYPSQLKYNVGDQLAYDLHGTLDARGSMVTNGQRTSGSYSTMDSTLVTQCQQEDDTSYLFVMNMFNTQVNVGEGSARSVRSVDLRQADDDDDDCPECLGYDMYYQQLKTGEIVQIWYNTADSPYFVNVKMGGINAFQTHIVDPNQQLTLQESDPVGNHTSIFLGIPEQFIRINKTFTQSDFGAFPDPNLSPSNIQLNALTSTTVHNNGYILSSEVNQLVNLVNVNAGGFSSSANSKRNVDNNSTTPLDVNLSSYGSLAISLNSASSQARKPFRSAHRSVDQLNSHPNFTRGTPFEVASKMLQIARAQKSMGVAEDDVTQEAQAILEEVLQNPTASPRKQITMMNRLARLIASTPVLLEQLQFTRLLNTQSARSRQNLLYILGVVDDKRASQLMVAYARAPTTPIAAKAQAVMAMGSMLHPTPEVAALLHEFATQQLQEDLAFRSVYALGAVVPKFQCPKLRKLYADKLLVLLKSAVAENQEEAIVHVIHAVGNAGPRVINLESIPLAIFLHPNVRVRAAAAHALRKYKDSPLAQQVLAKFTGDSSLVVRKTAAIGDIQDPLGSDFPFNKSYSKEFKLGGKVANVDLQGELFAGTNFDCNQQYFNYEALAQASCSLTLFSFTKQAVLAEAVYGRENGQALADEIKLTVWDDVIYDKPIPSVDCQEHTYDIGHTSPGFSVSYTLWISVIPVTFSASASLQLDLKWGWQICDSELLAMIELIPSSALVIDGNAEVDLLIIKAGITLSGQFSSDLIPQGYIHGSQCQLGFDVQWVSQPMAIDLFSYYAWKDCKYWIFDCHWGNHNQQTWYSWDSPAHDDTIFNQDWVIQP